VQEQISAAYQVLSEIGLERKDSILVINKIDRLPDRARVEGLLRRYPNAVPISARNGAGLTELSLAVSEALSRAFRDVDVEFGVDNGRLMAYLAAHAEVLSKQFHAARVIVHCRIPRKHLGRIDRNEALVRPHRNGAPVVEAGLEQEETEETET
jgi:GTP-binding protein HflX